MKTELTLTAEPLDEQALADRRPALSGRTGAVLRFVGIVRETEGQQPIAALEYEAFQRMVDHQFGLIFAEIGKRWPVQAIRVVHRIGSVRVNEPSLWVEVLAPHRAEAFAACQFLIDEMKQRVPIWKKPVRVRSSAQFPL